MYIMQTNYEICGWGECAIGKKHGVGKTKKTPPIIDTQITNFLSDSLSFFLESDVSLLGEMLPYLRPTHGRSPCILGPVGLFKRYRVCWLGSQNFSMLVI